MFGFVTANISELAETEKQRYQAVYCGICRRIREQSSNLSRLGLSYDMAFLALLLMSLYEPEEQSGNRACILHPIHPRPWVDNDYVRYAADMNVALAYYNCLDDWNDDRNLSARVMVQLLEKHVVPLEKSYPRQIAAIRACIEELSRLERENCANADETANCFGRLMAELVVYREDLWAPTLRQMGTALGRFIYLNDAAVDYRKDLKNGKYNPFIAMQTGENYDRWEQYLVLAMARCTESFEKLPLVQDKKLLDNILYSGVWGSFRAMQRKASGGKA